MVTACLAHLIFNDTGPRNTVNNRMLSKCKKALAHLLLLSFAKVAACSKLKCLSTAWHLSAAHIGFSSILFVPNYMNECSHIRVNLLPQTMQNCSFHSHEPV